MQPSAPSVSPLWFHRSHARASARLRLFCFPYAGGGIAAFRGWSDRLPADIEVYAAQLPGRDARMREPSCADLPVLVASLADALAPGLDVPYAFFGHSLGALVAFELTRFLRRAGAPLPVHLFASARRAPQLPHLEPPSYDLPDAAFVETLVRRYNGIPTAVLEEPELMALFLPILRADLKMTETYVHTPQDPLPVPITAVGGLEDPLARHADLTPWGGQTRSEFRVEMFPGGHFFVQTARDGLVQLVSRQLGART